MIRLPSGRLLFVVVAACVCWLGPAAPVSLAQSESDRARQAAEAAIDTRQATQQERDAWGDEKAALVARYRNAKANVEWLTDRQGEEQARTDALAARIAELERRLAEAGRLESSMQDTLQVIHDRLADSVQRSLPFLPAERRQRLDSLAGELVRPDVASGEKLRRLLEALQVEAGYAATVEVYQDRIVVDGQDLHADILRLGRVALFWRTPDGERVGTWDPSVGQWVVLPDREDRPIALAMEMATRRRPVGITSLPLGRIAP
jgi:hypothetical protein